MSKTPSCIISTGLGRLLFVPTAESLVDAGVRLEVIQGWVPSRLPDWIINSCARGIGAKHDVAAGLRKRRMPFLPQGHLHTCAAPEFLFHGLAALARVGALDRSRAACSAWRQFGRQSRTFLRGQDIFHVRAGAGRGGAIEHARLRGMRVVTEFSIAHPAFIRRALVEHDAEPPSCCEPTVLDPFWAMVLEDANAADHLLVNSHFVKKTFVDEGYPDHKITVLYRGVAKFFHGAKFDYRLHEPIRLLFVGGFGARKGARFLLEALGLLVRRGIDAELVVAGDATGASDFLAASPVRDRVRLLGHIQHERLRDELCRADVFVFPTLAEGCANAVLEAMGAGLPIVTTFESGAPIVHEDEGLIVPSKSAVAVADAVERFVADPPLRERCGRQAMTKIATGYDWPSYGRAVRALYERLLAAEPDH